jgi:uncharacterized membrane protein YkvA (DUF1232 family)
MYIYIAIKTSRSKPHQCPFSPRFVGQPQAGGRYQARPDNRRVEWFGGLLIVLGVAVAVWLALVAFIWLHRPSRHLASAAVRLLPDVLRMLRALVTDPATPRRERWLLVGLFAWLASPIDLLPEFLPGIGPLDDIVVAAVVLRWVAKRLGRDYLRAHWSGSDDGFGMVERLLS